MMSSTDSIRVCFHGEAGSYSDLAAQDYFRAFKHREIRGLGLLSQVMNEVDMGLFDRAIVPIENSAFGTLYPVYDALLKSKLFIVGEFTMSEIHCLCALPGVKLHDIKKILSHPTMLAICSDYIKNLEQENGFEIEQVEQDNTARSCSIIASKGMKCSAAIASKSAAELFGLTVLQSSIANVPKVATRYLVLSREPAPLEPLTKTKCSIAVVLRNQPMALFKALSCFALRNLNIDKVESRPAPVSRLMPEEINASLWNYMFYIDFECSSTSEREAALNNLKEFSISVREFGTYVMNMPHNLTADDWISFI